MDFLEQLDIAISTPNVYYHKFITSYKKDKDDIYVFCEGDVDFNYYSEQVERLCPNRVIHKCPAECKNNVLKIWRFIDWNYYRRNRVLFFVDRDLSFWANEEQYYDTNVYVTDGYSFENDAINVNMFLKLLEDLYGFAGMNEEEKNTLKSFYAEKWDCFVEGSYDLMGYALYKYLYAHEHTAKNLSVHRCISVGENSIWKQTVSGLRRDDYFRKQLKIDEIDLSEQLEAYRVNFQRGDGDNCT